MASRKRSSNTQDAETDVQVQPKKAKVNAGESTPKVDANGDKYWEISKMRRVTVSSFRGKNMVNLREYYEKDGQELPGKKGISMPVAQFAAFLKILPDIEEVLKEQGESVPRPVYSADGPQSDDDGDDDVGATRSKSNKAASPSKQNIEATSEEDESEA
ncbi:ssDNA-binding transcriptional regulator [Penicillium angulare]|uniref:ssDNA-binding transcriptional regulator n=1 Tax=Penicillium angulare TaxID=116970 RepID=UPI002541F7DC|nr:ssDNA-binding transcriptional regulator [Penicillium angulare]KAJ5286913.1 ssDNA-binding transcriptional regulator [Penicillium angulare]